MSINIILLENIGKGLSSPKIPYLLCCFIPNIFKRGGKNA